MNQDSICLIQEHTRKIYDLDHKTFVVKKIAARQLLHITRFDLFAKLYYIHHRESNTEQAKRVYCEHIRAFNPDLKEPGRDDKCGYEKFLSTFNKLIEDFAHSDFDESKSIVPVDQDGIILDGAHRVAALAFYDKEVTIAQFDSVKSKGIFDYNYFLNRGLSIDIADMIALEATFWCKNLYAACLWPKIKTTNDRNLIKNVIRQQNKILYEKSMLVSLKHLTKFVATIYGHQDWVGTEENNFLGAQNKAMNCYSLHRRYDLVLFQSALSLEDIIKMKETIRDHFKYGKHSIHITDNDSETLLISKLVLDREERKLWFEDSSWISINNLHEKFKEWMLLFKNHYLIKIKQLVYRILYP